MDPNSNRWSTADDRPYIRELQRDSGGTPRAVYLWAGFLLFLALAGGGAVHYILSHKERVGFGPFSAAKAPAETPVPPAVPAAAPSAADTTSAPATAAAPAAEPSAALPALDQSDGLMRDTVSGLVGRQAFAAMVYPKELVRRIVATVDNLPRETAPRRVMPVEPVPGAFAVAGGGEEVTLAGGNSGRYSAYVRVFETLDARAFVRRYAESYPLFQRAYAELGFPGRRFHDRLLEAMDDLLEAPELTGAVKLVRPKVFYQFADPELENLSAGQKIMIRMGRENAAKVKAKLRELRRELEAVEIGVRPQ